MRYVGTRGLTARYVGAKGPSRYVGIEDRAAWDALGGSGPLTVDLVGDNYIRFTPNGGTLTTETVSGPIPEVEVTSVYDDATELQTAPRPHRGVVFLGGTNPADVVTIVPPDMFLEPPMELDSWALLFGETVQDANSPTSFTRPDNDTPIHVDVEFTDANGTFIERYTAPATVLGDVPLTLQDEQIYVVAEGSTTPDVLSDDQPNYGFQLSILDVTHQSGVDGLTDWSSEGILSFTATTTLGDSVYLVDVQGPQGTGQQTVTFTTVAGLPIADNAYTIPGDMLLSGYYGARGYPTDEDPEWLYWQNDWTTPGPGIASGVFEGEIGPKHLVVTYRQETDDISNETWKVRVEDTQVDAWGANTGANGVYADRDIYVDLASGDEIEVEFRGSQGDPAVWAAWRWLGVFDVMAASAPTITGSGAVDTQHTATGATWPFTPASTEREWLMDGTVVATTSAYTPTSNASDPGLQVRERAKLSAGGEWTAWSTSEAVEIAGGAVSYPPYVAANIKFTQANAVTWGVQGPPNTANLIYLYVGHWSRAFNFITPFAFGNDWYFGNHNVAQPRLRATEAAGAVQLMGPNLSDNQLVAAILRTESDGAVGMDYRLDVLTGVNSWTTDTSALSGVIPAAVHDLAQTQFLANIYSGSANKWGRTAHRIAVFRSDSPLPMIDATMRDALIDAATMDPSSRHPDQIIDVIGVSPHVHIHEMIEAFDGYRPRNSGLLADSPVVLTPPFAV